MFCDSCQNNRLEYKDKCPECHTKITMELRPVPIIESIINKFKDKRRAINEILKLDAIKNSF
jgi:hypothetical protein